MTRILLVTFLVICPPSILTAMSDARHPADTLSVRSTSTKADSITSSTPDSLTSHGAAHDTLLTTPDTLGRMSTPVLVGTVDRWLDSSAYVTSNALHWIDFGSLSDILQAFPGTFLRDQVSPGQYSQLSFRGVDWRSIAITVNGRTLNDPSSGIYNLSYFSPEYADRIEVITGVRAFLYGFNSSGGTVNILTKNYNSNVPFTKLNYTEGPYNSAYTDGTFSQNVSRKVNLTFGFQHQGIDGRYSNSYDDSWDVRAKIRYNPVKNLNIIASEYFTSTYTDLNGGVDVRATGVPQAFDPLQASVISTSSYEKVTRHDIDLSLVGTFLGDSNDVSNLSLYYSHSLREYRYDRPNPDGIFLQPNHRSSWMGAVFTQNIDAEFTRLTLGGNIELRQIDESPTIGRRRELLAGAYGKDDLLMGELFTLSIYGRLDSYPGTQYTSLGTDGTIRLSPSIALFGGASLSHRMPNFMELYWTDSTVHHPQGLAAERHLYAEAGARITLGDGSTFHLAYFHRAIHNPILLSPYAVNRIFPGIDISNGPDLDINGLEAKLGLRLGSFFIDGNALYLDQRSNQIMLDDYPHLVGSGGVYFWDSVLHGKLELKAGIRGQFRTRNQGMVFNPELPAYIPNTSIRLGVASSMDLFLIARLGDAYIHIVWENLTDVQYFTTPFVVANDRGVHFGISWEFLK